MWVNYPSGRVADLRENKEEVSAVPEAVVLFLLVLLVCTTVDTTDLSSAMGSTCFTAIRGEQLWLSCLSVCVPFPLLRLAGSVSLIS